MRIEPSQGNDDDGADLAPLRIPTIPAPPNALRERQGLRNGKSLLHQRRRAAIILGVNILDRIRRRHLAHGSMPTASDVPRRAS
jgi:hypothetical protein